jgi:hypothetical protein
MAVFIQPILKTLVINLDQPAPIFAEEFVNIPGAANEILSKRLSADTCHAHSFINL